MDLRPLLFLISSVLITACGPSYETIEWWEEDEFGYEAILYEPDEVTGLFVYMTDSNESLSGPTALMLEMLDKGYKVVVPQRWGDSGRSIRTLDSYTNRLRGTSYSISKLYVDTVHTSLILFASDFYTPMAARVMLDFRADQLWLVQPLMSDLSNSYLDQIITKTDTHRLSALWEIDSAAEWSYMASTVENGVAQGEDFFGPHYSGFLRGYWKNTDLNYLFTRLDSAKVVTVFPYAHPLRNGRELEMWKKTKMPTITPALEDSSKYHLRDYEQLFIPIAEELKG